MENNILSLLSKEERKLVNVLSFKKNQIIYKEGERCDSISIIIDGKIQIVSYSFSGKEDVFNSISKNQIFGNNLLFSSDPTYKGDVISTTKTTLVIPRRQKTPPPPLFFFTPNMFFFYVFFSILPCFQL